MLNHITIQGRLTSTPELKTTQSGKEVTSFTIACDRNTSDKKTDFIPCVAWTHTAKFICDYFDKGQMILINGVLQSRAYEKNGEKRTAYEVFVDHAFFCGSKGETGNATIQQTEIPEVEINSVDDLPF